MIYFFDSSAFAKIFIAEQGSEAVGRLLASLDPVNKVVSSLVRVEVRSAIRRHQRFGSLSSAIADTVTALLSDELTRMTEHALSETILVKATSIIDQHGLRTLDSLQLATASVIRKRVLPVPVNLRRRRRRPRSRGPQRRICRVGPGH